MLGDSQAQFKGLGASPQLSCSQGHGTIPGGELLKRSLSAIFWANRTSDKQGYRLVKHKAKACPAIRF